MEVGDAGGSIGDCVPRFGLGGVDGARFAEDFFSSGHVAALASVEAHVCQNAFVGADRVVDELEQVVWIKEMLADGFLNL